MKKILITGSNGYIARNIIKKLSNYDITSISRNNFDMIDGFEVSKFFKNNQFDVVIHTCTSGGSRLKLDSKDDFFNNCLMHQNIIENQKYFGKYISFGSGAELDRRKNIDKNSDICNAFPKDPYGMSKNYIAKSGMFLDKFYNLRIFNVFNEDELESRMIKSNILNYINKRPIIIHQNKIMDFFYMDDLISVIDFTINNNCPNEINCVYEQKYKLSDIAVLINNLDKHKVPVILEDNTLGLSYYGKYNFPKEGYFSDLKFGIESTYRAIAQVYKEN